MAFAEHDSIENERWLKNSYVNNEGVSFEDELLDDITVDEMARISQIHDDFHDIDISIYRDTGASFNFKVGDLFEIKDDLLHTLHTWTIKRGVTYMTVKSISKCFNVVCSLNERVYYNTSIEA